MGRSLEHRDGSGQLVVAYVVADPDAAAVTADELEAHCLASEDLARFKRPRAYRFVDKLPMTPTGKKKHVEATAMAAGRPTHSCVPVITDEDASSGSQGRSDSESLGHLVS